MDGRRGTVTSADGTSIGLVTAGDGPPLLLVHGGMCSSARWAPLWPLLTARFSVTAMDRRGRGSSSHEGPYSLQQEFADVTAVIRHLAGAPDATVDVLGHSYGAVCALGAAAGGAAVRRLVLYEPPGPATVPAEWLGRMRRLIADGQVGHAMASFLLEVVGLDVREVERLRVAAATGDAVGEGAAQQGAAEQGTAAEGGAGEAVTAGADHPLAIAARTMLREAEALRVLDLPGLAARVDQPVMLLLGSDSPTWAHESTHRLLAALPSATLARLDGQGHEAVDTAPAEVATLLERYLLGPGSSRG